MNTSAAAGFLGIFRKLAGVLSVLATLAALACWSGAFDLQVTIAPADVSAQTQNAYTVHLSKLLPGPGVWRIVYSGDSNDRPTRSTLRFFENGRPLQPAHALHAEIRERGNGRYSHWGEYLIFSTSDNSNPRHNGRVYRATCSPDLITRAASRLAIGGIAAFLILFGAENRRVSLAFSLVARGIGRFARAQEWTWPRRIAIGSVILLAFSLELCLSFHFGLTPLESGDGWSYSRFADQLVRIHDWTLLPTVSASAGDQCFPLGGLAACSPDVPDWRDLFVFLFRMPGYPAIIAFAKWLIGEHWQFALVALQHLFALVAACVLCRTAARISGYRVFGLISAVLFLLSHRLQYDRAILTDSLCASALTIAVCWLVVSSTGRRRPPRRAFLALGLAFAGLFFIRETTLIVAAATAPLIAMAAWQAGTSQARAARIAAAYIPLALGLAVVLTWSYARTGYVFVSTQPLSAGLYSIMRLEQRGPSVFTEDTVLDRVARQTLDTYSFAEAMSINKQLLQEYGLSGPQQSELLTRKYFSTWKRFPTEMLQMAADNLFAWKYIFVISELINLTPEIYNPYVAIMVGWAYCCGILLPMALLIAGVFVATLRRRIGVAIGLSAFWLIPAIAYSVFDMELRYLIPATGAFLLIFALSGELLRRALRGIYRALGNDGASRPAVADANPTRDIRLRRAPCAVGEPAIPGSPKPG